MTGSVSTAIKSGRILLVDDDEAGRYAKRRILQQAGYIVEEAASGDEALRRATGALPDLVLLDVRLPDLSGLEVCRRLKANPQTATIPVLQTSASFGDDQSKVAGLQGGADGYIAEPIEPALLTATIAAFLRMRRAEQAVREHALEWQSTFDAIHDGVALLDAGARILRSNRALSCLFGRPAADLIGSSLDEVLPGSADAPIRHLLQGGERQRAERMAGDRVLALSIDPVCDQGGLPRGWVCIVSDITERKLMDEQLRHTQKLESIGVLAGGVAHDFNNLLMGILGNASLALESLNDGPGVERALHDIVGASQRAADLTQQLLAYSGRGRFVVQPIDLSRVVSGMVPLVKASVPRTVNMVLHLADGLPAIEADKTQIEQIIMNLLINAAEAIGENTGTVQVTTSACHFATDERQGYLSDVEVRGDYVALEVSDEGVGMDEGTLRRIFDPFFTTKFMGRGLGLSAVLGIVRGHKGAIRVSSAPGQGTRFELLFPVSHAAAGLDRGPSAAASTVHPGGQGTILVVDDEEVVRSFFQSALERQGYKVVVAKDGAEALRIFSGSPDRFSMVLLDLIMPVMSGKDVLPRLLEIRPHARILVTSGQVEEEVRRNLRDWDIAGFVQKPCTVDVFVEKIRAVALTGALAAE